jgi:hypothetical protein
VGLPRALAINHFDWIARLTLLEQRNSQLTKNVSDRYTKLTEALSGTSSLLSTAQVLHL